MSKSKNEPQTAMAKLMMLVDQLEIILHPRVIAGFKQAVWDARTEMAQEARDQKISRELQELEPFLKRYRDDIIFFYKGGARVKYLWHMRPLFEKIIDLYAKPKDEPKN